MKQVAVSAGIPQPHFKKTKQTANNFSVGKSGGARGLGKQCSKLTYCMYIALTSSRQSELVPSQDTSIP